MPGTIVNFFTSSIRNKVAVSFAIVIALILVMTVTSYYRLDQVRDLSEQITPQSARMGYLQDFASALSSLDANVDRFLVVGNDQLREDVRQDLQGMRDALDLIKAGAGEQERASLQEFEQVALGLEGEVQALLDADSDTFNSPEMNEKILLIYDYIDDARGLNGELVRSTHAALEKAAQKQMTTVSDLTKLFLALSVAVIGIVMLVWLLINRGVAGPLVDLTQTTIQIAAGDLEARAKVRTQDEVGRLAVAFNSMTDQLHDLVGNLRAEIAERERADAALRQSQQLLQGLTDNSTAVIYVKDLQGRYIMVNRQHEMLFGTDRERMGEQTDYDIFSQEAAAELQRNDQQVLEAGAAIQAEEVIPHDDGPHTYLSVKFPLFDDAGRVYAVAGISTDITGQKQIEVERERMQQGIIEAQRQTLLELSTPVIPVMERILVMPLVGEIDSARAKDIMRALLVGIREHRARTVILDITGVPIVDSGVAAHLDKTIQAARLKGAQTIITGISDAVAEAIVDLGVDWSGVRTLGNLQKGLVAALESMGIKLAHNGKTKVDF
jgi:PAS domain S-box-containing protein